MRPDLVLDDDEKKTRFRKFLSKKQDDNDHDESRVSVTDRNDSMSPSYDHESPQTPSASRDRPEFHSPIQHTEQAMRMSEHSSPHNPLMYNTRISSPVIQNTGVTKVVAAKSTSYLYDRPITEVKTEVNIIQNCTTSYPQNTSLNMLDNYNYLFKKNTFLPFQGKQIPFQMSPEKYEQNSLMGSHGESFRNWARFPQYLKTNQNHPSHPDPFYGNQVTYQSNHEQSNQVKAIEMMSRIKKEDMHSYPYSNSPANTRTVISPNIAKDESLQMTLSPQMKELSQYTKSISCETPSTSSKTYQTTLKPKEEVADYDASGISSDIQQWFHQSSGEELIHRYVNKKYGNGMFSFEHQSSFAGKFNSNTQDVQDSLSKVFNQGKRKSVIVRAGANRGNEEDGKPVEQKSEKLNETYMNDVIDNALSLIPDASEMLKNFNFDIMEDLYTNEEQCLVEKIAAMWQDKWNQVNFGQELVGTYISFCHNRREFPGQFFKLVNLQIRERCLSFVCTLDEIDQISAEDQIYLFRRNLDNAEMLAYVHSFNQKTWTEELEFVLGKNDKLQWIGRDNSISGLPLSTMVTHMPLSEEDKLELYKNLMSCVMQVLGDRTVFILMWLIIIFSQDEGDMNAVPLRIKKQFCDNVDEILAAKKGNKY